MIPFILVAVVVLVVCFAAWSPKRPSQNPNPLSWSISGEPGWVKWLFVIGGLCILYWALHR